MSQADRAKVLETIFAAADLIGPHRSQTSDLLRTLAQDVVTFDLQIEKMERRFEVVGHDIDLSDPVIERHIDKVNVLADKIIAKLAEFAIKKSVFGILGNAYFSLETKSNIADLAGNIGSKRFEEFLHKIGFNFFEPREFGSNTSEIFVGAARGGTLKMFNGDDIFVGHYGTYRNDVEGGLGSDTLVAGGSRRDQLLGGKGDDLLLAPQGAHYLDGGEGQDWLQFEGKSKDPVGTGGYGSDTLIGGASADSLHGVEVPIAINTINASPATDSDLLVGRGGGDRIYGGMGADTIVGDWYSDADREELFAALAQILTLRKIASEGAGKGDTLAGYGGDDLISGGVGDDLVYGDDEALDPSNIRIEGSGNDRLFGDAGEDTIFGGWGNDTLEGGRGDDTIYDSFAVIEAVSLEDYSDNDSILSGSGDDFIFLSEGNDTVDGEGGEDTVTYIRKEGIAIQLTSKDGINSFRGFNDFDIMEGKIHLGRNFDSVQNIETIRGSDYDDLYVIGKTDVTIDDNNGSDKYVIKVRDIWVGDESQKINIIDRDGAFSIKLDQIGTAKGIMFYDYVDSNIYDVWIDGKDGELEYKRENSQFISDHYQDFYISSGFGRQEGQLLFADPRESDTGPDYMDIGIHLDRHGVYITRANADVITSYNDSSIYIKIKNEFDNLLEAMQSGAVKFNLATQSFDFDFG